MTQDEIDFQAEQSVAMHYANSAQRAQSLGQFLDHNAPAGQTPPPKPTPLQNPITCAHNALTTNVLREDDRHVVTFDGVACPDCGIRVSDQALKRVGSPPYERERMRLADEAGALRSERDDLLRENATLRRRVGVLEGREKTRGRR